MQRRVEEKKEKVAPLVFTKEPFKEANLPSKM
jgi:hypothetical protein